MKDFRAAWKVNEPPGITIGSAIVSTIEKFAKEQLPHLADMFPFSRNWSCKVYRKDNWICLQLTELLGGGVPAIDDLTDDEVIITAQEIIERDIYPSFENIYRKLEDNGFRFNCFTYVGEYIDGCVSWPHIQSILIDFLNNIIVPEINNRNRQRILEAIPMPPQFDTRNIMSNIFILESEVAFNQGTCFHLKNIGLVTCNHVLSEGLEVFSPYEHTKKYPVEVISANEVIDLAIISAEGLDIGNGLTMGTSENLNLMEHIAIAGFPNYRYGDTGIFSPGIIIGFRPISSITRILINSPIIAGNSGGPVIDKNNLVIGVAVTGADFPENSNKTEDHGVIPIEAIKFLK